MVVATPIGNRHVFRCDWGRVGVVLVQSCGGENGKCAGGVYDDGRKGHPDIPGVMWAFASGEAFCKGPRIWAPDL